MIRDKRDLLEVLKKELTFLEAGGYARGQRTSWQPPFIFEDSPTCLDFNPERNQALCSDCVLSHLVPLDHRAEEVPCRYIPLNSEGETVESFYRTGTEQELEWALDAWLRHKIRELEEERMKAKFQALPAGQASDLLGS